MWNDSYVNLVKKNFLVPDIADQEATFTITDTKLYIPVVTLPTQDNAKT